MIISVFGESNARLLYVLDFIEGYFENVEFQVVDEIPKTHHLAVNYSGKDEIPGFYIQPSGFLHEYGSGYTRPELAHVNEDPVIFGDATKFGFDVFSAIFYTITRYEEYNELRKDSHGRFPAEQSIAHEYGFLEEAIVDRWVMILAEQLEAAFGKKIKPVEERKMIPSIDIDVAWAYRNKGPMRTVGAHLKDAAGFDLQGIRERSRVLSNQLKDPYDTYDFIEESFMDFSDAMVFVQMGNYGRYDKNVNHQRKEFRQLLKRLDITSNVAIHPSYASFKNPGLIDVEKKRLEEILDREVTQSRFHFLRFRLPHSYRHLLNCGIKEDFSMGYADHYGFRAGTSRPYYWYDIDREEKTELLIHPFVYMDGTLNQYMKLEPKEASALIDGLFDEVRCGNFEFIWHNSTLNERGIWKGWREVYKHTLEHGKKWERSKI